LEVVQFLLGVNAANVNGLGLCLVTNPPEVTKRTTETALRKAAVNGNVHMMTCLLEHGADYQMDANYILHCWFRRLNEDDEAAGDGTVDLAITIANDLMKRKYQVLELLLDTGMDVEDLDMVKAGALQRDSLL
jgi:hypothetical protein